MYAVVGCTSCGEYWLVTDPDEQDSATCPGCGRTHQTAKLNRFHTSPDRAAAVEARAALLADKRGESDGFAAVPDAGELERAVEDGETGVSEREYLDRSGLDPDAVAEAGDVSSGGSQSRDEIVREAIRESSDRSEATAYATARGVPEDAARDLLERLLRRGEATDAGGELRLL